MSPLAIACVCIDTSDPERLAPFWAGALGWEAHTDADGDVVVRPPAGDGNGGSATPLPLLLLKVPGGSQHRDGKNRLHLDLRPDDQQREVARLEALGARRVDIGQGTDVSWVVLADPDGNELCVLEPERSAPSA